MLWKSKILLKKKDIFGYINQKILWDELPIMIEKKIWWWKAGSLRVSQMQNDETLRSLAFSMADPSVCGCLRGSDDYPIYIYIFRVRANLESGTKIESRKTMFLGCVLHLTNASLGEKRRCFLGGFSNFRWPLVEVHIELIKKHMALVDETPHMGMLYGLHLSEMIQRNPDPQWQKLSFFFSGRVWPTPCNMWREIIEWEKVMKSNLASAINLSDKNWSTIQTYSFHNPDLIRGDDIAPFFASQADCSRHISRCWGAGQTCGGFCWCD